MQLNETRQKDVQGQFTTAEVTHVLEAIRMEGLCYLKNHLYMQAGGDASGPAVREWHDNVTRRNLDALKAVAKEMGLDLPFPKKLEDRENEIKEKAKGGKVSGILRDAEILDDVRVSGKHLDEFYTESLHLATNDRIRDAFRSGREVIADNLPRLDSALNEMGELYAPPIAHRIGYVAEKGVPPE